MSVGAGSPGAEARGPYNAGFDDRPQTYDELRAEGHMARRRVEFYTRVVDETPGLVLELGSGTGTLLRRLAASRPDRTFVGVEPLASMDGGEIASWLGPTFDLYLTGPRDGSAQV